MAENIIPRVLNRFRDDPCDDEIINREREILKQGLDAYINYCVKLINENGWNVIIGISTYNRENSCLLTMAISEMVKPPHGWLINSSTLVEVGRNSLVEDILQHKGWTHLWMLDTDTIPPHPFALMRMLQRDKDIVGGLYSKKEIPAKWLLRQKIGMHNKFIRICEPSDPLNIYPEYRNRLVPTTGSGLGCLLVKREVFENLSKPWFKVHWFEDGTLDHLGEDIYFFTKATQTGFEAYVDTSLICDHVEGRQSFPMPAQRAATPMLDGDADYLFRFKNLSDELAEFTGKSPSEVRRELEAYSTLIQKYEWEEKQPKTPAQIKKFYQETPWYLLDLVLWNTGDAFYYLMQQLPTFSGARVLDFGAGIGTVAMALAMKGNKVDYLDLPSHTRDFAEFRAKKYGLHGRIGWLTEIDKSRRYDVIVGIDIFEHLLSSDKILYNIYETLVPGGIIFCHVNFGQRDIYPMHIDNEKKWNKAVQALGLIRESQFVYRKPAC